MLRYYSVAYGHCLSWHAWLVLNIHLSLVLRQT